MAKSALKKIRVLTEKEIKLAAEAAVQSFDAEEALKLILAHGNPPKFFSVEAVKAHARGLLDSLLRINRGELDSGDLPISVASGCLTLLVNRENHLVTADISVDISVGFGYYDLTTGEYGAS